MDNATQRSDACSASALRGLLFSAAPLENAGAESLRAAELRPEETQPGLPLTACQGAGWDPALLQQQPASAASSASLRRSLPRWVDAPGILLLDHRSLEDRYKTRNAKRHGFCLSIYNKINIYILKILIVFSHESLNSKTAGERD